MAQRIRITFRTGGPLQYVAHLDTVRTWERAIRRANLPLSYSQGFSPHAKLQFAAPLPVGYLGERELLDLWLDEPVPLPEVTRRLSETMPPGLDVVAAEEVGDRLPALQASLRAARYEVAWPAADIEAAEMREALERLLALETLEWEEQRGDKKRRYDIRATLLSGEVVERDGEVVLELHVSLEAGRTGRPDQLFAALGVTAPPARIVRTAVEIDQPQVAITAWKQRGRFEQ